MAHSHSHGHGAATPMGPASRRVRLVLFGLIGTLFVATLVSLAVLWPTAAPKKLNTSGAVALDYLDATVAGVETTTCGPMDCETVRAKIDSGPLTGVVVELAKLTPSAATPRLQVGDRIVIAQEIRLTEDAPTYSFADFQRRQPLWALVVLFAVLVIGVARWRGLAALGGLLFTWWVIVVFMLPAILAGESPVAVALTAAALILFVILYLAHGFNARTSTALVGTLISLLLTGLLGWYFIGAAHLTGLTSDDASFLLTSVGTIDLSGLLLCGLIIGALGVLNDVTVTQAAAVWEVHAADPTQSVRRLYRSGMRVGRDHIASTVYTLVLAYAGASLPLLILFLIGNARFADVVTGEILAEEIVRTLVGSIGLVASVPITTYLAALLVSHEGARVRATPAPPIRDRVLAAVTGSRTRGAPRTTATKGHSAADPPEAPFAVPLTQTPDQTPGQTPDQTPAPPSEMPPSPRSRTSRRAAKEQAWQPPAAERDFWDR